MPAYVLALYGTPDDPAAFDAYYEAKHVPLAQMIPGLRAFGMSNGRALAPDGSVAHHHVALLEFDSLDDARRAFGSPEGQATAADLANFATGGVSQQPCVSGWRRAHSLRTTRVPPRWSTPVPRTPTTRPLVSVASALGGDGRPTASDAPDGLTRVSNGRSRDATHAP